MNRVPQVTHDKLTQYHTSPNHCDCIDYQRGGSYSTPQKRACKHVAKLDSEIKFFGTRAMGSRMVCSCNEWMDGGEGLEGSCVHTRALAPRKAVAHV